MKGTIVVAVVAALVACTWATTSCGQIQTDVQIETPKNVDIKKIRLRNQRGTFVGDLCQGKVEVKILAVLDNTAESSTRTGCHYVDGLKWRYMDHRNKQYNHEDAGNVVEETVTFPSPASLGQKRTQYMFSFGLDQQHGTMRNWNRMAWNRDLKWHTAISDEAMPVNIRTPYPSSNTNAHMTVTFELGECRKFIRVLGVCRDERITP